MTENFSKERGEASMLGGEDVFIRHNAIQSLPEFDKSDGEY